MDPRTGDVVIVRSETDGTATVHEVAADALTTDAVVEARAVGALALPAGVTSLTDGITAGDVSRDGDLVLLRTVDGVLAYERDSGSLADALTTEPCDAPGADEPAPQSLAILPDASAYVTATEVAGAIGRGELPPGSASPLNTVEIAPAGSPPVTTDPTTPDTSAPETSAPETTVGRRRRPTRPSPRTRRPMPRSPPRRGRAHRRRRAGRLERLVGGRRRVAGRPHRHRCGRRARVARPADRPASTPEPTAARVGAAHRSRGDRTGATSGVLAPAAGTRSCSSTGAAPAAVVPAAVGRSDGPGSRLRTTGQRAAPGGVRCTP